MILESYDYSLHKDQMEADGRLLSEFKIRLENFKTELSALGDQLLTANGYEKRHILGRISVINQEISELETRINFLATRIQLSFQTHTLAQAKLREMPTHGSVQ